LKKIYIFLEEFEYSQHQEMINVWDDTYKNDHAI
jgi:hypothetical protein